MKKDYEKKNSFNYGLIIKTAILNIITTAAFIFIFAVVMYLAQTGYEFATVFATVSLAAGSLVSAFYLARKIGKKGFLVGLLVGGAEFIIVTLISMFVDKGGITVNTLFHLIIILLSSLIGGIVGVNKAGKQKYI
ncbi:MAG: TIGR04086 family membrane protein [Acutalibacteraceae bacterium]|nr:TIGR04086 family membrane protein [Acutalibacteraceae bacterium]